jgi:hypothetical protein
MSRSLVTGVIVGVAVAGAVLKAKTARMMGGGITIVHDTIYALMVAWGLALASVVVTQAAENQPPKTTASTRAHPLRDTVKKDAKDVGSVVKESAHRVAVAAKAVAHEIASATKRGAAETRAAIKGEKRDTTSAMPAR